MRVSQSRVVLLSLTAPAVLQQWFANLFRQARSTTGKRATRKVLAGVFALATLATSCSSPAPTDVGETLVNKWKDGKKAVYLLSFDDNLPSQLDNVIPELNKREIIGNFYVVPGGPTWAVDEQRWVEAAQSPYVALANHTFSHEGVRNADELDAELENCNQVLYKIYSDRPQPFLLGWGLPGGVPWEVTPDQQREALRAHNLVERPPFSGSPSNYSTQDQVLATLNEAIAKGEMGHNDMHGVGGDYLVTPTEWLIALLDQLATAKDLVWVPDVVSYTKYLKERETARAVITESNAGEIRIALTSDADSSLYDYPLTLTTKVPAGWKSALVTQGFKQVEVAVKNGKIMYEAVPGTDEVRLVQK